MKYIHIKRMIDFIVSFIAILILFPIFVIIAIFIKIDSKGPVFFKQDRIGLHGKVFKMYKFRSMYIGSEKKGVYEKKDDPRVTRVGKLLRKTSIDELPQLINILKGDMSIVGPRPVLTYHPWPYEEYTEEQRKMFQVRPGLTGWAQIHGRKQLQWNRRIELNIEYVEKVSFWLDLRILFITIYKVLFMKDNYNDRKTI